MREKVCAFKHVAVGLCAFAIALAWVSPAFPHPTSPLLAHCITGAAEPDARVVERAVRDAEAALRLDPQHGEGRLQLAIALSLKSRNMDVMAAWSAGYGEKGKKLAEQVLKADPGNAYAHGFLAVWNLEVARRGGAVGAWMLGASTGSGRSHYEKARALAPDDIGMHWQYARALAALDLKGKTPEVRAALDRALGAAASNHVEQVMQARAQQLSDALAGDSDAAQRLAQAML